MVHLKRCYVDRSYSLDEANAMAPLMTVGRCRKAELKIRRDAVRQGVYDLKVTPRPIHAARHELLTTESTMELAFGLLELGQAEEGLKLIDESIDRVKSSGELIQLPELLRVKGELLCELSKARRHEAELCYQQSLDLTRSQGSRAWELRAAVDLAALTADTERRDSTSELPSSVYFSFR